VIDRRTFVTVGLFSALPAPALYAQQARPPVRLGFLRIVAPPRIYIDAFEQGLRDRGYAPGRDVEIEYRFAEGREEELDRLAKELVARKVAIILVAGNRAIRAANRNEAIRSSWLSPTIPWRLG
jgi:putative ABC transport system substrate-binding protein